MTKWFGVVGQENLPFFFPMPVPGGQLPHWRTEGVVAQNTMTALKSNGWVLSARDLGDGRGKGYPLRLPDDWPDLLAEAIGDADVEPKDRRGLDLAALGVWLARTSGLEADGPPGRSLLVAFALESLGLPADDRLTATVPPVLDPDGSYSPQPSHFSDEAISEAELLKLLDVVSPPPAIATVRADEAPPEQVVRTTLRAPDPRLQVDDRIRRMLRLAIATGNAVLLVGPPGTGKTSLIAEIQHELMDDEEAPEAYGLTRAPAGIKPVTPDDDWNSNTLIGGLTIDEDGQLRFRPGYVLEAIRNGEWLLLDEANRGDLDKIFGGLLTWLTGEHVVVGRASTHPNAPSVVLEWSDEPHCEVIGYERLAEPADGGADDGNMTPIVFRAGTDWRLLGTYNPVDAQRVFKIGQALGRRFRRVAVPPVDLRGFKAALAARAGELDEGTSNTLHRLYEAHSQHQPPLGPAPFLDIADYVRAGLAETVSGVVDARNRRELLAEGYLASLGAWLVQLEDDELDRLAKDVGDTDLGRDEWLWIKEMRRSL